MIIIPKHERSAEYMTTQVIYNLWMKKHYLCAILLLPTSLTLLPPGPRLWFISLPVSIVTCPQFPHTNALKPGNMPTQLHWNAVGIPLLLLIAIYYLT